jgi:hypothetical protein
VLGDEIAVLAQPVAHPHDLDDDGLMKQAVVQGRGHHGITEHLTPFGKVSVQDQDHRSLLTARVDKLEEQVASTWDERQAADLVHDQERGSAGIADLLA